MSPMGFFPMFGAIHTSFFIIFFLFLIIIIIRLIQSGIQWNKNNNSPVLTVEARVVAKRTAVGRHRHHHHHHGHMHTHHTSYSSSYFVTFEFESGDRMEFHVPDSEYGYLVEGDYGKLTFQGTRYKGFQRL